MDAQIAVLESTASSLAALAAQVAGVHAGVAPDAGKVRDLLIMCEEDLLSAADALHKTLWAIGSTYNPAPAGQVTTTAVLPARTWELPAPRRRPVSRRRDRVVAGQEVLFALPETA